MLRQLSVRRHWHVSPVQGNTLQRYFASPGNTQNTLLRQFKATRHRDASLIRGNTSERCFGNRGQHVTEMLLQFKATHDREASRAQEIHPRDVWAAKTYLLSGYSIRNPQPPLSSPGSTQLAPCIYLYGPSRPIHNEKHIAFEFLFVFHVSQ